MPALGMAQETGKVLRWLKAEGDEVTRGEPLMEVETDKVTVEIEAPTDGLLAGLRAAEGADVPVGEAVAVILAPGEALPENGSPPAPEQAPVAAAPVAAATVEAPRRDARRRPASPKARRLAAEQGIDLDALGEGSGPGGAVVAADVLSPASAPAPAAQGGQQPLSRIWSIMAERTAQSWASAPHFYLLREVDAGRLSSWRSVARDRLGRDVSVTDLLVRATAAALARHPQANAAWDDGSIRLNDEVNVGIAVAVDDGLVVPVIHGADRLGLGEIAARREDVVSRAREGALRPEDVERGTFTISNLGMYGVDAFNAVVNSPQAAILAVGRIVERVVPVEGSPGVRPMMALTLSCDHRAIDGARAARFLSELADLIEEPAGLAD
jgi:pyruvate dehydrogenase E2 component (dihydrolipoamide acetyltransferase)